jgi:hypothetical protein
LRRASIRQRQHIGGAAHVLFHDQHAAGRLQIEPAGVETDPLADQRHPGMGGVAPAKIDQARCAGRGHPDGVDQREVLPQQIVPDNAVEIGTEALREMLCRLCQLLRPHVVRRRIDEVAGKAGCIRHPDDVGRVDAVGRHQSHIARIGAAIAAESIASEREGQRRKAAVVRRVGEAIEGRRQQAGQRTGPERIAGFAGRLLQPEQDVGDLSIGAGQCQAGAGLTGKAVGRGELPGRRRQLGADRLPCRSGRKNDGNG